MVTTPKVKYTVTRSGRIEIDTDELVYRNEAQHIMNTATPEQPVTPQQPVTPEQPFSTILALAIMKLVRSHDIALNELRHKYLQDDVTMDRLTTLLEAEDVRLAEAVLDVCRKNLATLESTVDSVLKIQEEIRQIRDMEAMRVPTPA